MPFVAVFVFRQKMRQPEIDRIMVDIPEVFTRIAQSRGKIYDPSRVGVVLVDGAARNVFSPESHAKGFQGLDILMLVFAKIPSADDRELLRETLEAQFRDRWVTRARIFDPPDEKWKVSNWSDQDGVIWDPN